MKSIKYASLLLIAFVFLMGCSGTYGKVKSKSRQDSKVTKQELIDNWSDYDIKFKQTIIVFDPTHDDKKILVGSQWGTVKDQETWKRFVEENTDNGGNISPLFAPHPITGVREIWSSDGQFYGYVIHQARDSVYTKVVGENTMRLYHILAHYGGGSN